MIRKTMQAWHFLSADKRLGYDDGRAVEVGVPLECEGEPELCTNGMHGSVRLIDALYYARGPIVCRVEIEGDIIEERDKLCGRRRTVLWWLDATRILHEFACMCAEGALALDDEPDPRSVAAVAAKRKWLNGEITDEELDAAHAAVAAAWAAAWAAADAVGDARAARATAAAAAASRTAAFSAAHAAVAAAWAAAWAAADAAAYNADARAAAAAADAAAYAAAIAKYDARLTKMIMAAHEDDAE